jgi:hypothetical protein
MSLFAECSGGIPVGQPVQGRTTIIPLTWRNEWFANLCLVAMLFILFFLMVLSIYLVVTKPVPVSIPNTGSGSAAAYADCSAGPTGAFEDSRVGPCTWEDPAAIV